MQTKQDYDSKHPRNNKPPNPYKLEQPHEKFKPITLLLHPYQRTKTTRNPFDKNGDFKIELEKEKLGIEYIVKLLYGERDNRS